MRIIKDDKENIDIIKSSKRYFSKENLNDYYDIKTTSQESFKIGLGLGLLTTLPTNSDPLFFQKTLIYYIFTKAAINFAINAFPKGLNREEVDSLIKNSEQYAECSELYTDYIKNVVDFYRSIDKKTAPEIATFFDVHLRLGMFNQDLKPQEYRIFKHNKDFFITDILGSTVMTGTSVCRHNASFLTDILCSSGFKACNLPVPSYLLQKLKNKSKHLNSLRPNHLITGIIENDENYIYDPTKHCFGFFSTKEILNGINPNYLIVSEKDNPNTNAYIIKEKINKLELELYRRYNSKEMIEYQDFISSKHKEMDFNYLEFLKKEAKITGVTHQKEILNFNHENRKTVQKIKKLNETLAPKSDTKITTWKIK